MLVYRVAALIANNIAIADPLPLEVGNGVVLRRPDDEEADRFRSCLADAIGPTWHHWVLYESVEHRDPEGNRSYRHSQNRSDWNYFVLADDDGGARTLALKPFLQLLDPPIDLSIKLNRQFESGTSPSGKGFGHFMLQAHIFERYYSNASAHSVRTQISSNIFLAAELLRQKSEQLSKEHSFINEAIKVRAELRTISDLSQLQIIGLFSIIESLICHLPRQAESLDSISHQVQGKLQLLKNRSRTWPSIQDAFGEGKPVWKTLYSCRSALAHGARLDFEAGDFRRLKSLKNVFAFLSKTVSQLLKDALEEPQFFTDLKAC